MAKVKKTKKTFTGKGKIVSEQNIFFCKRCKTVSNVLYRWNGESYCEKCVPKRVKDNVKEFKHSEGIMDYD